MVSLLVERFRFTRRSTISNIFLIRDGVRSFVCHGLEDVRRPVKIKHETAIPAGRYPLALRRFGGFHKRYSQRFDNHDGMLWVQNVPNFTDILIHCGNGPENTSGCLLVGQAKGDRLVNSRREYVRLYHKVAPLVRSGELQFIEFIDGDKQHVIPNTRPELFYDTICA